MNKPARGRARNSQTDAKSQESRVDLQQSREDEAHKPERPARVSMGATLKLDFGSLVDDANYHFRVISDRDGRVDQAKQAWYEHVLDATGEKVVRHSGPYTQFLMKIKKEFWVEDQNLKLNKTISTLKAEQKLAPDEYIPDGNHHVLQKDDYDPLG